MVVKLKTDRIHYFLLLPLSIGSAAFRMCLSVGHMSLAVHRMYLLAFHRLHFVLAFHSHSLVGSIVGIESPDGIDL